MIRETRLATNTIQKRIKRTLIGPHLLKERKEDETLTKKKALAILSSDAISSVAYATEAGLVSLLAAGSANLGIILPISIAIVGLLIIVVISYRQTIPAYPNGGGAYVVASENLGKIPGLVAAASLLIDYILTVSVSVSAGVLALVSLIPGLAPYTVILDIAVIVLITAINLRGIRESGTIFAIPTYIFIACAVLLIVVGIIKSFGIEHHVLVGEFSYTKAIEPLSLFLVLKSFAAACSAMTGVEAVSTGVPVFKNPKPANAKKTLLYMGIILGSLFLGISLLTTSYHVSPTTSGNPTVIAQIAKLVFTGPLFIMFPVFQIATLFILSLAANTSYSAFPWLASVLGRDKYFPHQFTFRGSRLAYSTGILTLSVFASFLLIAFDGDTSKLINLYAVGVFLSFTLSQAGMVRHWLRHKAEYPDLWLRSLVINATGAFVTFCVALIIGATKFLEGAWVVVLLIPILVIGMLVLNKHYSLTKNAKVFEGCGPHHRPKKLELHVIGLVSRPNTDAVEVLRHMEMLSADSKQVFSINIDVEEKSSTMTPEWEQKMGWASDIPFEVLEWPVVDMNDALENLLEDVRVNHPERTILIVCSQTMYDHWWEQLLHTNFALLSGWNLMHKGVSFYIVNTQIPKGSNVCEVEFEPIQNNETENV